MVRFLLLSLWILAIGGGSAQKISGQTVYKAHVSDAEGNAVEYATAVLLSGEKQVGGAVANSDGDFSMEAEAGKYRLVVQCLGYEPLRKELILPAGFLDSRSIEPCSEGSRCSSEEYRAEGGPLYHVGHAICRKGWYGIIIAGTGCVALGWNDLD